MRGQAHPAPGDGPPLGARRTGDRRILRKGLFEVLPDNPDGPAATGVRNLEASLKRVLHERTADAVALQEYDVHKPDGSDGASPASCAVRGVGRPTGWPTPFVGRKGPLSGRPCTLTVSRLRITSRPPTARATCENAHGRSCTTSWEPI